VGVVTAVFTRVVRYSDPLTGEPPIWGHFTRQRWWRWHWQLTLGSEPLNVDGTARTEVGAVDAAITAAFSQPVKAQVESRYPPIHLPRGVPWRH
jgi:hypothetical protein